MSTPVRDATFFQQWAGNEGAEIALGTILTELRDELHDGEVTPRATELLTVAEELAARVTQDLRTAKEWEARRAGARRVIRHADAEVRRADDAEATILMSAQKRNGSEGAAMIQRAASRLGESLGLRPGEPPIAAEACAVREAAAHLRSLAAMAAVSAMIPAVLGDEALGAALTIADDTLAGIGDARRRDAELSGMAACLLEALDRGRGRHRERVRLADAAEDVAKLLEGQSITPRNEAPMLVTGATVMRWRERLPEGGPEARRRVWRQFIDWADGGSKPPYWLARTAHQLRTAYRFGNKEEWEQRRTRLAVLLRAPADGDLKGWLLVAAEVRGAIAQRLGRPPGNLTSPPEREREAESI